MIGQLKEKVTYFAKAGWFVAHKHLHGYDICPLPTFEKEGLDFFMAAIERCKTYLEFGSGGSTIVASRFVTKLVSVETDRLFAEAVRRTIPRSRSEIHLITPNIGMTGEWGYPIFGRPTPRRIEKWKRLPMAPWSLLRSNIPDTILIDGRMRVACALESLLHVTSDTRLLVDDYVDRKYQAIESFATLVALHGRMAEFRKKSSFDGNACREALESSYSDLH
jgi:hypothetical protein